MQDHDDNPSTTSSPNGEARKSLRAWFADPAAPVLLIAEVAQGHDGSLGTAHAFVDVAAESGVDAIKFQTHIASEESTEAEPWRVRFSPQDERRFDYWRRMEWSAEQWAGLKRHAEDRGLIFLSSPFSIAAVDLLSELGIEGWKIASGELTNFPLLERMRQTGLPLLLSSGMSDWEELDRAVESLQQTQPGEPPAPLALFQCTSAYPCPPEQIGLNLIAEIEQRYGHRSGLSDHSGTIYPILAGVALGMRLAEFHITLSRRAFGPDVPASLTPDEAGQLVTGVRSIEKMLANPVDKELAAAEFGDMRRLFQRSIVAAHHLSAGHRLEASDLAYKKPGTGLPPAKATELLGRRLGRSLERDEFLTLEDVGLGDSS